MCNTIAERLIKCRGDKSQALVAKDTGIAPSTISMYENGERIPRDSNKVILAKYYNKSIQELFF